jgi:hypothetical protein
MSAVDLQFARLAMVTKIDSAKWKRIVTSPPDIQRLEILNYIDQDWTDPGTPVGQEVLAILGVIGAIGGDVSGAAGAVSALAVLKSI